ncbi:TetR/AcrR family transcriptional regulator [Mycobacteroides abscessus]
MTVNGAGSGDGELTARRRKEIGSGACQVFDQRGYAATRISDISEYLGVGQGTIYRYFTGKEDLMDYIIGRAVRRLLAAMREDSAVAATGVVDAAQFVDQITAVARRLLEMSAQEQVLVRVLLNQAPAARPEAISKLTDQLAETTVGYLNRGVERGYLKSGIDTAAVADAMTGIALPAMHRVLAGQLDAEGRKATAQTIGGLIGHGIVRQPE